MSPEQRKNTTPRTVMIGGKAFSTYTNAKRIVKLVNDVGAVVNNDRSINVTYAIYVKCRASCCLLLLKVVLKMDKLGVDSTTLWKMNFQ